MFIDVLIPQLGEGLREVRIVRLLKQEGDLVRKDEPLLEIETDKAQAQIESAYEGTLRRWLANEDDVLSVGAAVVQLEVAGPPALPAPQGRGGGRLIPPRTRAHCRALGISAEEMAQIPAPSGKLMPADVDAWAAARRGAELQPAVAVAPGEAGVVERPLSAQQRALNYRMKRSAEAVVPATIKRPVAWGYIDAQRERLGRAHPSVAVSELEVLAWCAARAAAKHPRFRSALLGEDRLREHAHVALGIAVERPDDDLVTAVVVDADALDFPSFVEALTRQVRRALEGEDQAMRAPHLVLTTMGSLGITDATPVLVAPAAAVLFVGAPHAAGGEPQVELVLTFDHRLINGGGAARFLGAFVDELDPAEATARPHGAARGGEAPLVAKLRAAEASEQRALLEEHVRGVVSHRLGVSAADVDPRRPLRALGLGSRHAAELSQELGAQTGLTLSVTLIWNHPTVAAVAQHLGERLGLALPAEAPRSLKEHAEAAPPLDDLSRDDLERLLADELLSARTGKAR